MDLFVVLSHFGCSLVIVLTMIIIVMMITVIVISMIIMLATMI